MAFPSGEEAPEDPDKETPPPANDELTELRTLLLGPLEGRVAGLQRRLDDPGVRAEEMGQVLPAAIMRGSERGQELTVSLRPNVEEALHSSVARNPQVLANALFPVMGPAIRKSVREFFRDMVQSLNRVLESGFSLRGLRWRFEALRTGKSFAELVLIHNLLYRVEQVFLIHRETGLLLQHAVADAVATQDGDMVSGMLTAIQDFVQDSFRAEKEDALQTLRVGDLTVRVERGPHALIAAVVRGSAPPELSSRLQEALESIHLKHADALRSFQGDTSALDSALPDLEGCLVEARREGSRQPSRRLWLVFGALLGLVLVWCFFAVRSSLRWARYVEKVRAQPGIVVIGAEKRHGKYHIYGLRDPSAVNPEEMLKEAGLSPAQVAAEWEPYQALLPKFILQNAARLLNPPASVSLRFEDGVLYAKGTAPYAWIADARRLAPAVPGVIRFEGAGLRDATLAQIEESQQRIGEQVLYFVNGTTQLVPGQESGVSALVVEVGRLRTSSLAAGRSFRIEITGHTDKTGSEATNSRLSQARADWVASMLASRGIERARLRARGIGWSQPLSEGAAEQDRALNRRVSFRAFSESPATGRSGEQ